MVGVRSPEAQASPGAQKAIEDERVNLDKHDTWRNSEAREWSDVKGPDAKVIRLHIILGKKHVERAPQQ